MSTFKLLVVEDDEQDLKVCKDSIERYKHEHDRDITLVQCRTVEEALSSIDNSLDGAIIDLKLQQDSDAGNDVVQKIADNMYRVPVAIYTGTPAAAMTFPYLGIFKKGEVKYSDLFDKFWGIHDTGMTRILGGRGLIEETLKKVFEKNLLPALETWVAHGKANPERTEKALLRHTINHLMQLLDHDDDFYYPDEFYISPPLRDNLMTGTIVIGDDDHRPFVILNPACDLVIRSSGVCKTDRILLVEIVDHGPIISSQLSSISKADHRKDCVKKFLANSFTEYYHWLPSTASFTGGLVNFRRITTFTPEEVHSKFSRAGVQISPPFVKDMIARFSGFYARQGQPDIDSKSILKQILDSNTPGNPASPG